MPTLLHHIQPWMQKSITESEDCLERKMHQFTERKIVKVNQRLDAFELRVLARPALRWMCRLFKLQSIVFVQTSTRS